MQQPRVDGNILDCCVDGRRFQDRPRRSVEAVNVGGPAALLCARKEECAVSGPSTKEVSSGWRAHSDRRDDSLPLRSKDDVRPRFSRAQIDVGVPKFIDERWLTTGSGLPAGNSLQPFVMSGRYRTAELLGSLLGIKVIGEELPWARTAVRFAR